MFMSSILPDLVYAHAHCGPKYGDFIILRKKLLRLLLLLSIYGSGRSLFANEMRHYFRKLRGIPSIASGKVAGKFKLELVNIRKAL